jgi:hypothetical protein
MKRVALAAMVGIAIGTLLGAALGLRAQEVYTADDTLAAIAQYSEEQDVSYRWLYSIVRCETAGTFDPYSIGRQGELGAVQLHPRGELKRFYAWGYFDPFSPWQSVRFLAQRLAMGGARAWSCA